MNAFAQMLLASARLRVPLDELRRLWLLTHPEQIQHPERDRLMLDALSELAEQKIITLPSPRSFVPGRPPLPRFVRLARPAHPARDNSHWAELAWRPELGFWTELSPRELETAEKINAWLIRRHGTFGLVPVRERSLEIFHDEKYLDQRIRENLRRPGAARSAAGMPRQ